MLQSTLQEDLKQAQLNRDEQRVSTLRLLLSEIRYAQISKREDLSDEDILQVIAREVKKRKESAIAFHNGGREELAKKEEKEAEILQGYLPVQLSDEALTKTVEDSINEVGAKSVSDMGRVIGLVMGKVKGQADGGRVSAMVKEKLGSYG